MAINERKQGETPKFKSEGHEVTEKLGENLKRVRLDGGYSRERIAERSGICPRYLIAIENERRIPKLPVLYNISRALGISIDSLLSPENYDIDPALTQLIRLIYACDVQDRKVVLAVVNALIDRKTVGTE